MMTLINGPEPTQFRRKERKPEVIEHFAHDVCAKCGGASVPAEGISDQSLRLCPCCDTAWFEDLSQPIRTTKLTSDEDNT